MVGLGRPSRPGRRPGLIAAVGRAGTGSWGLGVKLAIDDFGTGYSSLSYLERFPVDSLKIDRAFVSPIGTPEGETSLASAIVSLARSLHLHAVAEGVETQDQAAFLSSLGCDYAQGYYFSRPVGAEAIQEMLEDTGAAAAVETRLAPRARHSVGAP